VGSEVLLSAMAVLLDCPTTLETRAHLSPNYIYTITDYKKRMTCIESNGYFVSSQSCMKKAKSDQSRYMQYISLVSYKYNKKKQRCALYQCNPFSA